MTLLEFQSLSKEEQITILYHQGVYVGKRKADKHTLLLYQLESFYVELSYVNYRRSVYKIHVTDATIVLDPYLEQITIEYLVM